jgi:hypothetical protein
MHHNRSFIRDKEMKGGIARIPPLRFNPLGPPGMEDDCNFPFFEKCYTFKDSACRGYDGFSSPGSLLIDQVGKVA